MPSHPSLHHLAHRPWLLPTRPWVWRQSWRDLLFAHWPIPAERLRHLVPPPLTIDTFDGTSWIGLVPFRMAGVMRRPLPDLPYFSAFPELNLRLYVTLGGRPGVWFLSLDAANRAAVWAARRFFHLPYVHAAMSAQAEGEAIRYESSRLDPPRGTELRADYQPTGPVYASRAGSLEHWLTERYCLYARSSAGQLYRADVHHAPWPLQSAVAEIQSNTIGRPHGLDLSEPPTLLHFSRRIDVVVWSLEPIGS